MLELYVWVLRRRFAVLEAEIGTIEYVTDRVPVPYCRGCCARNVEQGSGSRVKSKDLLRQCMLVGGSCTLVMMVLLLVVPAVDNGRSTIKNKSQHTDTEAVVTTSRLGRDGVRSCL